MTDLPDPRELVLFRDYLKTRGLKLTAQRNVIAKRVLDTSAHFSADELVLAVARSRRRISKATVYRTLQLLEDSSLLSSVELPRGHRVYEAMPPRGGGDRLVCLDCKRVSEVEDAELPLLRERIAARYEFKTTSQMTRIFGTCAACAARNGRAPR